MGYVWHMTFFLPILKAKALEFDRGHYMTPPKNVLHFYKKNPSTIPIDLHQISLRHPPRSNTPRHIAQSFLGLKGAGNKIEVLIPRRCCFFSGVRPAYRGHSLSFTRWFRIIQIHPPKMSDYSFKPCFLFPNGWKSPFQPLIEKVTWTHHHNCRTARDCLFSTFRFRTATKLLKRAQKSLCWDSGFLRMLGSDSETPKFPQKGAEPYK